MLLKNEIKREIETGEITEANGFEVLKEKFREANHKGYLINSDGLVKRVFKGWTKNGFF